MWNICFYNLDAICIMHCTVGASQILYTVSFTIITSYSVWDNLNENSITDCATTIVLNVRLYEYEEPKEKCYVLPYWVHSDAAQVCSSHTGKHKIVSHCYIISRAILASCCTPGSCN